jgi:hypothetical protein
MLARGKTIALAATACLVGMVSIAHADMAQVKLKLTEFKSASAELRKLFAPVPAGTLAKSSDEQVQRALARRDAADKALSDAIQDTMKTLDPSNQRDGEALEQVFDDVQKTNKAVTDDQLRFSDSQAVARAAAAEAAAKKKK